MNKKTIIKTTLQPDITRQEAEQLMADLGRLQRLRQLAVARTDDAIADLQRRLADKLVPINADIERVAWQLQQWAIANRPEICPKGQKTVTLTTGAITFRLNPRSVSLRKVADVIKALKAAKLTRFIRTKEEVDKEAILREATPITIPGLKIVQTETLSIKPNQTEIEPVALELSL